MEELWELFVSVNYDIFVSKLFPNPNFFVEFRFSLLKKSKYIIWFSEANSMKTVKNHIIYRLPGTRHVAKRRFFA